MIKTPAAVAAVALLGSALVGVGTLTTAALANSACVTQAEFDQVMHGMTEERVAAIFGTHGKVVMIVKSNGHVYTQRLYDPCPKNSYVAVFYEDGHETDKSAKWGAPGPHQALPPTPSAKDTPSAR